MYIDWNLNSGFQAFDFTEQEAQLENIRWIKENAPEYYDATVQAMGAQAGFADKQLDQAWRIAQMGESGANSRARTAAASSRYSADASTRNAKISAEASKYGVDVGRLTDQEKIALERELGYADVGLKQGGLGLDYLKTASELRGPENYLQAADFMRGASQRQDVPIFLQNLMQGVSGPVFQAPGGSPQGINMAGLMAKIGGGGVGGPGGTGPTGQDMTFLQAARAAAAKGFHTFAPGTLEGLSKNELGAFKSATDYGGDGGPSWNWDDLLKGYQNAGIGQGNPNAA